MTPTDIAELRRLRECELFLLDMDGTLYLGDEVFDGAVAFVEKLIDSGRSFVYLTNNSSRAGTDYIARMRALGFPCGEENVFTSGMAAGELLRALYSDSSVYVLGTEALRREIASYGVEVTDSAEAETVLAGFDTELTYRKLDTACRALRAGARFLACNPDLVCPMPGGVMLPDCGSICALLEKATGRAPEYIGKPQRRMVDILSDVFKVENGRIACVGDRLYTDIAVAAAADAVSVLLMSGETTEAVLAESELRPDYVFANIAELGSAL